RLWPASHRDLHPPVSQPGPAGRNESGVPAWLRDSGRGEPGRVGPRRGRAGPRRRAETTAARAGTVADQPAGVRRVFATPRELRGPGPGADGSVGDSAAP